MSYRARLRVELADRPGSLARVAAAIGEHGANVVGVDVQEVDADSAVDELVVDVPDNVDVDSLRRALVDTGAGVLVSHQSGMHEIDPVLRALRWACAVVSAGDEGADDELVRALSEVCGTDTAWLAGLAEAPQHEAGRMALDRGGPVSHRDGETWLLAVPDARLDPRRVAFVGRPLSDPFTATEVARVEALLGLRRQVETVAALVTS
jgi:hypothetical protein